MVVLRKESVMVYSIAKVKLLIHSDAVSDVWLVLRKGCVWFYSIAKVKF